MLRSSRKQEWSCQCFSSTVYWGKRVLYCRARVLWHLTNVELWGSGKILSTPWLSKNPKLIMHGSSVCNRLVTLECPVQNEHLPKQTSAPPAFTSLHRPLDITIHPRRSIIRLVKPGQWHTRIPLAQNGIPKAIEGTETRRRLGDADSSGAEMDIAAFKRISVVPIENKKITLGSSQSEVENML